MAFFHTWLLSLSESAALICGRYSRCAVQFLLGSLYSFRSRLNSAASFSRHVSSSRSLLALFIASQIALAVCLCPAAYAQGALSQPHIEFLQKVFDFGAVKQGEKVIHLFKFTNKGGGALKITKIKASCKCESALLNGGSLKHGETGEIKVTFNTKGKQGKQDKAIIVHTNDPNKPTVTLRLIGYVEVDLRAPKQIYFGDVQIGKGATKTYEIFRETNENIITRIESTSPFIEARIDGSWGKRRTPEPFTLFEGRLVRDERERAAKMGIGPQQVEASNPARRPPELVRVEQGRAAKVSTSPQQVGASSSPHRTPELVRGYSPSRSDALQIKVTLKPNAPSGLIEGKLNIYTKRADRSDNAESLSLSLNVGARVKSPVTVFPRRLFLGRVRQGRKITREIFIKYTDEAVGDNLKIGKIQSHADYISTRLEPLREGREYVVTVAIMPEASVKKLDKKVEINIKSPVVECVTVPVYGIVR